MIGRSTFIGASLALATAAGGAKPGDAAGVGLVEPAGEFDVAAFNKRVSRGAEVRHVWDAGKLYPQILGGVKNSLNGLQFGFGIAPNRIVTAFVTHNESNLLLYNDAAWATYRLGELYAVRDPNGAVVTSNIFAPLRSTSMLADPGDVRGFYQDASIAALQRRGVMFFLCNTALVQQAHQIATSGAFKAQSADDIARTLQRSLLPGVMLVPAGVAAVAYLQSRFHYAYLSQQ
jgi:intracellular sulfur oxidation DsrE/DsrF family protein